ncbi:MAG: hypothetical protein AB7O97_13600 [Planctomycetota bacterium]
MNCSTCQYELSQCLDGRLPSGRRAVVMDHVAACAECDRFWRELQGAQALVLNLQRHRVEPDFRDRLFERVQTGEGTPPAVFQEQVSLGTKVRYLCTGAAAAAAVLVAATLLRSRGESAPEHLDRVATTAGVGSDVRATGDAPRSDTNRRAVERTAPPATLAGSGPAMRPRANAAPVADGQPYVASQQASPLVPREPLLGAVKPLTPDLIAVETARQFENRHRFATQCLSLFDQRQGDAAMANTICEQALELDQLGGVLSDLRDSNWLSFHDVRVDADLRVFLGLLDREQLEVPEQRAEAVQIVRRIVAPALRRSSSLGQLTNALSVTPSFDAHDRTHELMQFTRAWPDVIGQIFFVLPSGPDPVDVDPLQLSRTFRFQDSCGPVYVTPMSEVQGSRLVFRRLHGQVNFRFEARSGESAGAEPAERRDDR